MTIAAPSLNSPIFFNGTNLSVYKPKNSDSSFIRRLSLAKFGSFDSTRSNHSAKIPAYTAKPLLNEHTLLSFRKQIYDKLNKHGQGILIMLGEHEVQLFLDKQQLKVLVKNTTNDQALMVGDFDQFIQPIYDFFKEQGHLEIPRNIKLEAELNNEQPFDALKTELKDSFDISKTTDFGLLAGVAGLVLIGSFFAAKAGLQEYTHSKHEIKEITKQLLALDLKLDEKSTLLSNLEPILNYLPPLTVQSFQTTVAEIKKKKEKLLEEKKLLKCDQKIGITSFISAGAIFSKSLIKVSASAATFSGVKLTAAAGIALNISTQMILTPLAGAFAFATSVATHQKNKRQQKILNHKADQLAQRFLVSEPYLQNMPQSDILSEINGADGKTQDLDCIAAYQKFSQIKIKNRKSFFSGYQKINAGFMIASLIYTAAAIAKGTLFGLTVGGVSIGFLNPLTGPILTTGLTVGAVLMICGSIGFILANNKQVRYKKESFNQFKKSLQQKHERQQLINDLLEEKLKDECFISLDHEGSLNLRRRVKANLLRDHALQHQRIQNYCHSIDKIAEKVSTQNHKFFTPKKFSDDVEAKKTNPFFSHLLILKNRLSRQMLAGISFIKNYIFLNIQKAFNKISKRSSQSLSHSDIMQISRKNALHTYEQKLKTLTQNEFTSACQEEPTLLFDHFSQLITDHIHLLKLEIQHKKDLQTIYQHLNFLDQDLSLNATSEISTATDEDLALDADVGTDIHESGSIFASAISRPPSQNLENRTAKIIAGEQNIILTEEEKCLLQIALQFEQNQRFTDHEHQIDQLEVQLYEAQIMLEQLNSSAGHADPASLKEAYEEILKQLHIDEGLIAQDHQEEVAIAPSIDLATQSQSQLHSQSPENSPMAQSTHLKIKAVEQPMLKNYIEKISTDWLFDFKEQRKYRNCLI